VPGFNPKKSLRAGNPGGLGEEKPEEELMGKYVVILLCITAKEIIHLKIR
jgi:hypothetical protein